MKTKIRFHCNSTFSTSSSSSWDATINLPQSALPIRSVLNDQEFKNSISEKLYESLSSRSDSALYNLIDGPPFANGDLHVGHALNKFLKDTILRAKALQGHRIDFRPAWDCHGLPIELKAIQRNRISPKSNDYSNQSLDPLQIRSLCRKFALEAIERQKDSMQKWGLLADFNRPLLTMDPNFEANQLQILAGMVEKNLIYNAKKPVFYSPSSQTALAEAELEYSDSHISLTALIRFKAHLSDYLKSKINLNNKEIYFVAWTTTPWTLPSNKALAVGTDIVYSLLHSVDSDDFLIIAKSRIPFILNHIQHSLEIKVSDLCRGEDLSTCHYESLPFDYFNNCVNPVLIAEFVKEDSGSGIVHLAPDYGVDDFELCKSVGIAPNSNDLLNDIGDFNESAPTFLTGKNIFTGASEAILEYLKETGNFLASKNYTHRYPYDWRTGKPIIQRATRQWFASISSILPQLQNSLDSIKFIPENGKDRLVSMLKSRTDWCISRQRHWGLPIPAFLDKQQDNIPVLDPKVIRYVADLIKTDPLGSDIWWKRSISDLLPYKQNDKLLTKTFDTLDVWFDSGTVWNNFPQAADLYLEGCDQYRGWFQSSLITSVAMTGKSPYKAVLTHGFVLDQKGQKMSKSIGNVIDPDEIVNKHGIDVLRLWAVSSNFKMDVNIGPEIIKQILENKRKIRNTLRFIIGNLNGHEPTAQAKLSYLDELMLTKLDNFVKVCQNYLKEFDFSSLVQFILKFCSQDLSAFYFEILKDRLYTEPLNSLLRQGAQKVLLKFLDSINFSLTPIIPILCQEIFSHYRQFLKDETSMLMGERHWPSSKIELNEFNYQKSKSKEALDHLQTIRSNFLEWFNTKGRLELKVNNTFQLNLEISLPSLFYNSKITSEDLREIFMVANVRIVKIDDLHRDFNSENEIKIFSIKPSENLKCPRCWTFNSLNINEPCPRCLDQINYNLMYKSNYKKYNTIQHNK